MCGIAGQVYFKGHKKVNKSSLVLMTNSLKHRGPDGSGFYLKENVGLAMRRLAVIDLIGGIQPIYNESKSIYAVFNGEIYNYRYLRNKLINKGHHFNSHTDSEVIVHLYEEYKLDFVNYLEGMFAIALWDKDNKRLVLVRDRLGIKPLYYMLANDQIVFASEIKAIKNTLPNLTIDTKALKSFLSLLYIPAPLSIYKEIKKLQPGHMLILNQDQVKIQKYWFLEKITINKMDQQQLKIHFLQLLEKAIKDELNADVPVGCFLSGGLDSSAVVALAAKQSIKPLKTFTAIFKEDSYNESSYARLVADYYKTDHTELIIKPKPNQIVKDLVSVFDEPYADSSAIAAYYLAELTSQHVTVALSGDGGDELFAGYVTYKADKLANIFSYLPNYIKENLLPFIINRLPTTESKASLDFKLKQFINGLNDSPIKRHYNWKVFMDELNLKSLIKKELLTDWDYFQIYEQYLSEASQFETITKNLYADTKVYLVDDNLTKVDRTSMAHSLEVRVPILNQEIVEFAFSLSDKIKMPKLNLKHFMKQSLTGILPSEIINRPKAGFSVPMPKWLKTDLKPQLDYYLSSSMINKQGYFNDFQIQRIMSEHQNGLANHSRSLWGLLNFSVWVEQNKMEI